MDISKAKLTAVLAAKGVANLYHANSVLTAFHFIREGALLSRGTVDRMGLKTTSQQSDPIDRRHSIWFDVFVDTVDIHHRARKMNVYGPVLFVLDPAVIQMNETGAISVTARNPMGTTANPNGWVGLTRDKRWLSASDLDVRLCPGNFEQMIVFRHTGGTLPFNECLKEVILDDPGIKAEGVELFSAAYGTLSTALATAGLEVPIRRRPCRSACACRADFVRNRQRTRELFLPMP